MTRAKRNIAYLLSMTLILTSLPTRIFAQNALEIPSSTILLNKAESTTSSSLEFETTTSGALEIIPSKYIGDGYEVEFKVTNKWPGGFNGEFILTNTGDEVIENWTLQYDFEHEINNIWNARIITHENNTYIIKNQEYNQDIAVGSSITIGFQGVYEKEIKAPKKYDLLGGEEEASNEDYTVLYSLINDWGQGYNAEISITNNGDQPIEDWSLEFDFDTKIDRFYTAEILEHEGEHYIIKNLGYNANIKPGETINLGFEGKPGNVESQPVNYKLIKKTIGKEVDEYLKIDTSKMEYEDGIYILPETFSEFEGVMQNLDDIKEVSIEVVDDRNILVYKGAIKISQDWSTNDIGLVRGNNIVSFAITTYSGEKLTKQIYTKINSSALVGNLDIDISDADGDGLWNYFEDYLGTDKNHIDTDRDGLTDYEELYILGYNPLQVDSNSNGINDFDEDEDGDSLTNGIEFEIGSSPLYIDSDLDELLDNEEMELGTDPNNKDTDADGLTDYEEFILGTDMKVANDPEELYTREFEATDFGISKDTSVYPSIQVTSDAKGIITFDINERESDFVINPSMTGYIGKAYDFSTSGNLEEAILTFTYDIELIPTEMDPNKEFIPTIYYYNEDSQELEEVENQYCIDNQVIAKLEHFSTYMLLNKADLQELFNRTIELPDGAEVYHKNQVVFLLDTSGSMSSNDPNNIRASLTSEFINNMNRTDEVGIIGFSDYPEKYTNRLLTDRKELEKSISDLVTAGNYGGTYINRGLVSASGMFGTSNNTKVQKCIFLLTDGSSSDTPSDIFLENLKIKGIKVYTIGLGNVSKDYLVRIADKTGGEYYYAKTADDLDEIFIYFGNGLVGKDENKDLLSDYYAKLICSGEIVTKTGTRLFYEDDYEKLQSNSDFDGDGLKNGEEIFIEYYLGNPYIMVKSSPIYYDSDFDGYSDFDEITNLNTNPQQINMIVDVDDYRYFTETNKFGSKIASDKYLSENMALTSLERYFDVLIGGGEVSLTKMMRSELVDYIFYYAEETSDKIYVENFVGNMNSVLRGVSESIIVLANEESLDALLTLKKAERIENVNEISKYLCKYKHKHNIPKQELLDQWRRLELDKKLTKTVDKLGKDSAKLEKFKNYTTGIGIVLTIVTIGVEAWTDGVEYSAAVNLIKDETDFLDCLQGSAIDELAQVAYKIKRDIESEYGKIKTLGAQAFIDSLGTSGVTAISIALTTMGPVGIIVDLVSLTGTLIVGDSMSIRLKNNMDIMINQTVNIESDAMKTDNLQKDSDGNLNIVIYESDEIQKEKSLMVHTLLSIKYCEEKYLGYLNDNRWGMNQDFFIYKNENSITNAEANIDKLKEIYERIN